MPVFDGPRHGKVVFKAVIYVGLVVYFVLSTNMSKLSFRARALDASKPMPIFMAEELPDLPDYSAINRAVPQMPSGMEKEEECEHHLQRAICAGLIIPTPEVSDMPDPEIYDKLYPSNYKCPRQLIHMQPFTMEQDIPDYDMDSEDERWLESQAKKLDLSPLKFEEMMDRLEKSSGQTVVTLNEAKALLKEDDDLIIAVFDYWLNKRLKTQHPLILTVRTEQRAGTAVNNPYLAFRRRTEKMQTRKNRKNDETSYEKMLKLRRDLSRAVTLLDFVKRREKIKREYVHLTVEIFEKRYQAKDFNGAILSELSALKTTRHAFTPIIHNHYSNQSWSNKAIIKDEVIPRKEKRQYKKRKHKLLSHNRVGMGTGGIEGIGVLSSDDEPMPQQSPEPEEVEDEGQFAFRRNKLCSYHMPKPKEGNWPWCSKEDDGLGDKRFRFTLTSLSNPKKCIGFARRRMGRGGRVVLDRISTDFDDYWRNLDYTIYDSQSLHKKISEHSKEMNKNSTTNSFTNLAVGSSASHTSDSCSVVKTEEIKTEFPYNDDSSLRTSYCEFSSEGVSETKCIVKQEPQEIEECAVPTVDDSVKAVQQENVDEMLDILREVQKDWLHFRPKTPPPGYEPPCHLLPVEDSTFLPNANTPFTLEVRPLDSTSTLLDSSTFITSPFLLDDLTMSSLDVPVTDTRQSSEKNVQTGINVNVNVGRNTLTCTDSLSPLVNLNDNVTLTSSESFTDSSDYRTVGCSQFNVYDSSINVSAPSKKHTIVSSTLTSPKLNSVKVLSEVRQRSTMDPPIVSANGLVTSVEIEVPGGRTKNNKMHSYAYTGRIGSSGVSTSTFSFHTSTPTVTLNSHSANLLEIPLKNDTDAVQAKVNSHNSESGSTSPNNKNSKTIVRKSNFVMEVT